MRFKKVSGFAGGEGGGGGPKLEMTKDLWNRTKETHDFRVFTALLAARFAKKKKNGLCKEHNDFQNYP